MKKTKKTIGFIIIFVILLAIMQLNKVYATEIEWLNITIPELVSGQNLITNCSVDDDSYSARIVKWYKGGNQQNPGTYLGLNVKY